MGTRIGATRGYLAGFGTSGSLLAGAALLFLLGSAIVAFRGWPQMATGPATTAVAAPRFAGPSHVARRLAAVIALRAGAAGRPGAASTHSRLVSGGASGRQNGGRRAAGVSAPATGSSGAGSARTAFAAASCATGGCPGTSSQGGVITHLADVVAQGVSDAGSSVSSQVHRSAAVVAGAVGSVSPPAAGAVQNTGDTAANAVAGGTNTAVNTLTQVGAALGGGGH